MERLITAEEEEHRRSIKAWPRSVQTHNHWKEGGETRENVRVSYSTHTQDCHEVSVATVDNFLGVIRVRLTIHHHDSELVGTSLSTSIGQLVKKDMDFFEALTTYNSKDSMG